MKKRYYMEGGVVKERINGGWKIIDAKLCARRLNKLQEELDCFKNVGKRKWISISNASRKKTPEDK